nr:hypothetical protein [Tanacetum cinerariifolium]
MTLVDTLIKLKDNKAKGVTFKDSESTDKPTRSILTLKPLPAIDPKDKGKGVLEEPELEKKMTKSDFDVAQIARDEEIARQLEVELQAKVKRERQREEKASMDYIANLYEEVQARIDADHELAVRWTHEEHEKYTMDKEQSRFTHSQLNKKSFEDIQGLYMKEHELIANFVPIGSEEDERMIRDMNKKAEEESSDKVKSWLVQSKRLLELAEYINTSSWNRHAFYNNDEDDDEEFSIPISEFYKSSLTTITPDLPITDFLIMEDEHLDTILEIESDKLIKSSVENLVPTPSESEGLFEDLSEDLSDIESECDSFSDADVPKEIYSNPLFDEEIISIKIDVHHFNVESDLIESLLNQDSSIISSPNINSLLEEFSGELAHIDSIPPGINEAGFDLEEEIRLIEKLLYDNSSPCPPEEFNSKNSDAIIESFSPSPIFVEDSDSLMEEVDLFLTLDDSMPSDIENDDYDSEEDILFLEELFSNDSPSLSENKSFHFDVPSSPRPPTKPPNDGIYFDNEPVTGILTAKVVGDISKHYVLIPRLLPTQPTLCPVIDTLLPFSSENEDKVYLLSHQGFKAFQLIFESSMLIYEGNIPILDVPFFYFYPP